MTSLLWLSPLWNNIAKGSLKLTSINHNFTYFSKNNIPVKTLRKQLLKVKKMPKKGHTTPTSKKSKYCYFKCAALHKNALM